MRKLEVRLGEAMAAFDRKNKRGKRLTQKELAEMADISRPTISDLARGNWADAKLSTIEKICRALNCQPEDILVMVEEDGAGGDEKD